MAAEVPLKDVLCEAMAYLSKLGSNLRIRSENLKEKKIRRDKLNNALALQKAANKVLLICELSKKSLDNVETGVRKLLKAVDISQATLSDGGNSTSEKRKSIDAKPHYYTYEYKSKKFRIKKKVNLKHFTSVKVHCRSMPSKMIEKYPVYYDCKLYRIRKEKKKNKLNDETNEKKSSREKSSDKTVDVKKTSEYSVVGSNSDPEVSNKNMDSSDKALDKSKSENCENSDHVTKSPKKNKIVSSDDSSPEINNEFGNNKKSPTKKISSTSDDSESDRKKEFRGFKKSLTNKNSLSSDDSSSERSKKSLKKVIKSPKKKKPISSNDSDSDNAETNKTIRKNTRLGKEVRRVVIDSSEDESTCVKESKEKKTSLESNMSQKNAPHESENDTNQTDENGSKPICDDIEINQVTEDEEVQIEEKAEHKSSESDNDSITEPKPKKRKINESKTTSNAEDVVELESSDEANKEENTDNCEQKPVIKCVSLTKLLKPDIIDKNTLNDTTETTSRAKNKPQTAIRSKNKYSTKMKSEFSILRNEEFWKKKRREVAAFKPKSFSVNVSRLPKLHESFLQKHNLKKVTENGKILLSINDSVQVPESDQLRSELNDKLISEANNVKSALLFESDSDGQISAVVDKIKDSLLNNSDSEQEEDKETNKDDTIDKTHTAKNALLDSNSDDNQNKTSDINEELKKKLLDASDSDKNCEYMDNVNQEERRAEDDTNAKSPEKSIDQDKQSLLHSSDDKTETETPLNERKGTKPESLKKRMREDIRAKKMLLTYSSSSETEDEQLREVLREIRDSLLKDDDTSNNDASPGKKEKCDSDDSLKKTKKKHKKHRLGSDSNSSHGEERACARKKKMVRSKSKPGNCSSQNSDGQDTTDKEIDGLANLKSINKPRRINSSESDRDEKPHSKTREKRTPPSKLIEGDILQPYDSSDDESTGEVETLDEDMQPTMTINGDSDYLAKDDLLGESDSSVSNNENNIEETIVADSDEEGNKSKSDSDTAITRRKTAHTRISDFEDSDDANSESTKKSKRKKQREIESDASGASSNESGGKKKRRRIKVNDSDGSGSETENEGRNKHGRKNIRKVMGKNQLEEATKKAAREEKERIARIAERQKLYNNLEFDESGKPDEVVLEKVVLDFDPSTKEPLIEVDRGLVKKLKPHQANGIKFMWDACFESAKRIKKDRGSGCILAHCMGLGKTLQVVTLTHTLLIHNELTGVNRVLVVCPLSTVLNWVNEFRMWLKYAHNDYEVDVYELSRFKQNSERAFQLSQWFQHGGVCVLGYEMFRNLSADNTKKFKKKMLKNFQEALVDPGPDLVVCDEGHLLKNEKTSLSQSMNKVKTLRRIVLTGTPLQNNLKEYYCMVQFVKPNLLGKYNEYLNRFVNPITNGQYTDSTEHDIKIMKRRSHVLHKMLDGAVQRRDYGVLAPFLPPKHEYVLFITLTEVQIKLYQCYLDNYSRRPLPGKSSGFLFPDFQSLQRIWTHPLVLKYNSERYEIMQQKKRDKEEEEESEGSLVDFIDDDSTAEETSTDESSDDLSDVSDDSRKKSKKKKSAKKNKGKDKVASRRGTRANPMEHEEEVKADDDVMEVKNENPTEWWIKLVSDEELDDMRNSHKLILLFDILRQCEAIGDKLLVFSQSLYSLDLIEHFLGKVDDATQEGRIDEKLAGHVGSWSPGIDYFRLDGSTSCENRSIWCKNFNREDNPRARLFLISTRAGGLGINLVAANRVVIFDVSWNPSHDVQSIFRVYRFGQKKPCYVYRFLAMGTMEEKIYERQVTKQAISKRVIDEQQIDRHYAENDLAELYKFEPQPPQPRPLPPLPKDRLFAEMLKEHEAQIYKYHEHDSLLENKEEETLSEEERKAAWEDFENEKNRPPPAPFPSPWPMHNGMVPGLLAQQQQQLAYAALATMLRKDMPNINDNQIRDMLPLIYNANPAMFGGYDYGLMQKMSELYKYTQPGMMNPMMAPNVMNSASGGGAGAGGASGLQYEPPWQRQHHQQQQMRLQQILQQQNQMGAKFYSGGLGSRDPVAMALQQQRAREIMVGGAGTRPRGRPPAAPRAPPNPADVVNLDSD